MYEKIICLCFTFFLFFGCCSTRIHDNGNGIDRAREDLLELEAEQREVDESIGEIADGVRLLEEELTEGFVELETRLGESITSLAERTDNFDEFERIISEVRRRKRTDTSPTE